MFTHPFTVTVCRCFLFCMAGWPSGNASESNMTQQKVPRTEIVGDLPTFRPAVAAPLCVARLAASLSWRRGLQTKGQVPSSWPMAPLLASWINYGKSFKSVSVGCCMILVSHDVMMNFKSFKSHPSTTWPCAIWCQWIWNTSDRMVPSMWKSPTKPWFLGGVQY